MNISEFLQENGQLEKFSKGGHVFRQGEKSSKIYFIKQGLLKGYYLSSDGKEHVKSFLMEQDVIGSLRALSRGEAVSFNWVCWEKSELMAVSFDKIYQESKTNIEISNFFVEGLIGLALKKEKREYDFLCMSAEDRYRELQEQGSQLLDRVTQNDIAKYLGITPVALSRIRKRISEDDGVS